MKLTPRRDIDLALLKRAQTGHEESLTRITEQITEAVSTYIYRLTLNRDLSDDLTQDTMVSLLQRLKSLRIDHVGGFWAWTYRTALSNVQHHYRSRSRHKTASLDDFDFEDEGRLRKESHPEMPNSLIREEKFEAVFQAMKDLKLEHRHILVLRCLEELSYTQIVKVMGGTELRARLLFLRAKQSLKRRLTNQQFETKHLLPALGLFAWMTEGSSTAKAAIKPVAAQSLEVGGLATSCYFVTTVPGILSVFLVSSAFVYATQQTIKSTIDARTQASPTSQVVQRADLGALAWQQPGSQVLRQVLNANSADTEHWYSIDTTRTDLSPVITNPSRFFAKPSMNKRSLLLYQDHVIEFPLTRPLQDVPGPELFVFCSIPNPTGPPPITYCMDQTQTVVPIAPTSYLPTNRGTIILGYDIDSSIIASGPTALRIVGRSNSYPEIGYGIQRVRVCMRSQ